MEVDMALNVLAEVSRSLAGGRIKVIDLTQPLGPQTPVIQLPPEVGKNSPAFEMTTISRYDRNGPAWYWNEIRLGEHTGTHFDAPIHWITGRDIPNSTTDTLDVARLVGAANVIDVSEQSAKNPDYLLRLKDLEAWEAQHGRIGEKSWVLLRTDWSKRRSAAEFLNVDATGPHSPGLDPGCAKFLAQERDILGFGVETVGTDAGQAGTFDPPFPAHHYMHGAGRFGLASLSNLDRLPPTGAIVIAAPLKIVQGSGSPCRVMALVASD
jgi:kynurenine formamidase